MQFIKSLFCTRGCDNRARFLAVSAASLVTMLLGQALFFQMPGVNVVLVLIIAIPLGFSAMRRLRDSARPVNLTIVPLVSMVMAGLAITFIDHGASYLLLLLPVLATVWLAGFASKTGPAREYVRGYLGPIDLSMYRKSASYAKVQASRVEPTMLGGHQEMVTESPAVTEDYHSDNPTMGHAEAGQDWFQLIGDWFNANRRLAFIIGGVFAVLCLVTLAIFLWPETTSAESAEIVEVKEEPATAASAPLHRLELPDEFALLLDAHNALIINWQADEVADSTLWSVISAQGDKSCSHITFNNNDQVRTTQVLVENSDDYFAYFSPLDTQRLIKSVAARGSFTLCGYKFSLKGSQKALTYDNNFGRFLD